MIISKYAYLTEEERAKEFGRIIGKALRKLAREKELEIQKDQEAEDESS